MHLKDNGDPMLGKVLSVQIARPLYPWSARTLAGELQSFQADLPIAEDVERRL